MAQLSGDPTYYEVLGVAPTATSDELKSAYRRLSRQIHPDAGGNGALFHLVATAYETLSDPSRRSAYDLSLRGTSEELPAPSAEQPPPRRRSPSAAPRPSGPAPAPRTESGLRGLRMVAGAAIGALWYLLRATGALSWAIGSVAAGRWLPAAVESWARPFTAGRLLLCVATGGALASSPRVARMARWIGSRRRWCVRGGLFGLVLTAVLLSEYLSRIEGRRLVVIGTVVGALMAEGRSRLRQA